MNINFDIIWFNLNYDIINPLCSCGKELERTLHYLLPCDLYSISQLELLNDICALKGSLKNSSEEEFWKFYFMEQKTDEFADEFWNFEVHNKVY